GARLSLSCGVRFLLGSSFCSLFVIVCPWLVLVLILPPPPSPLFPYTTLFRSTTCVGLGYGLLLSLFLELTPLNYHRRRSLSVLSDRKSTRLNSSHVSISYAVFCLNKKK